MSVHDDFPILRIKHADGDDALLDHSFTAKEQAVFSEMNAATSAIAEDSALEAYYEIVIPIGGKHGLSPPDSVAFWTRSTLSCFEP